jgi:hypothetical protein
VEAFGQNPSERLNASFSPDLEEAAMNQEIAPVIMGPPAYSSPDPKTAGSRLVPLEEHPLSADLSEDYGAVEKELGHDDGFRTSQGAGTEADFSEFPEDRKEWSKTHWQRAAKQYDLPSSGNTKTLKKRVEDYEAERDADTEMKAADWNDEIDKAKDADALALIEERYTTSGADFSTVQDALDKKKSEFAGDDDGDSNEQ